MSASSVRQVAVWCPEWAVVAAATPAGTAAAVIAADRVMARSAEAEAAGVVIGQRRRDAQRCCPELVLIDHDPRRDASVFEPIVRSVAELAPRLEVIEPGWLNLPARGPSRYYGGDQELADRLSNMVHDLIGPCGGRAVGVGIADGRAPAAIAARLAARRHRPLVVPPGGSREFLASRPLRWLSALGDLPPATVGLLDRLGLRTFGDLAALEPAQVSARFGAEGIRAHRIACGEDARPPSVADPPVRQVCERIFPEPVGQTSTVVFCAKQLADELIAVLSAQGRVCCRLQVLVETDHGERSERIWYRDAGLTAAAVVERVRWQLDGWVADPGITAGVVLIRLTPIEVRADVGQQIGLWGGRSRLDDHAHRAITRLIGLAGPDSVRMLVWRGGRMPADRFAWVPASTLDLEGDDGTAARLAPAPGSGPWPGALPSPSPTRVLSDPIPIELHDAQGQLVQVNGRGELSSPPVAVCRAGRRDVVVAWAGPWPLDQHWWEPRRHRRLARFQLLTETGDALLVILEQQQWWLAGTY